MDPRSRGSAALTALLVLAAALMLPAAARGATELSVVETILDDTPPETTIDSGPSGRIGTARPTFTFSSEPGATFKCSVTGMFPVSCTSPYTTPELLVGTWTFTVTASDALGNEDPTPATRTFTVDTAGPQTTVSGPGGLTRDSTPTFDFSSPAPGTRFECRFDDAAFAACPARYTAPRLRDGIHSLHVRAVDSLDIADSTPAEVRFAVDTRPPVLRLGRRPVRLTPGGRYAVEVTCVASGMSDRCEGRLAVVGKEGRRLLRLGSARFDIGSGERAKARLKARGSGLAALRASGRLRTTVQISVRDTAGNRAQLRRGLSLLHYTF